jgi:hypothetical protein
VGFHGGHGSRFGDAGSGDDRKDPSRVFRSEEADQGDLPRVSGVAEGRAQLDGLLLANQGKPARERLTLIRIFEELRGLGYEGSYDAVRRYAKRWRTERGAVTAEAYVPLSFAPGEAYQFDWSHEVVLINGTTSAQARRQLWLMAGYGPSSKAVSAVSPASASTGR